MEHVKKIEKNTRVKIMGMPDLCENGFDFIEESTLWESSHIMMKHLKDDGRQPS